MSRREAQEIRLEALAQASGEAEELENIERINQDIEQDILENVNAATGERWRLYASRIVPGSRRERELFNIDPGELKQKNLHDRLREFGDGVYRVRIYKNTRINNQYDIEIEVAKTSTIDDAPRNDFSAIAEILRENNRQNMEFMTRLEERLSRQIVPVAATPAPSVAETLKETLGLVTSVLALAPKPENNMIEVFKLGMEMRGQAEGGSDTGVMDVLLKLAEKVDLSQLRFGGPPAQANPAPRPALPRPPSPHGSDAASPAFVPERRGPVSHVEDAPPQGIMTAFAPQVAQLVEKAARNSDPDLWAGVLLDEMPPPALNALMNVPHLIEECGRVDNRVFQYRAWFSDLLAILREEWEKGLEAEPDPVSRTELHDTGQPPGNAIGDTGRGGGNGRHVTQDEGVHPPR